MLKIISNIFVVLFLGFTSIFALDVYGPSYKWYEMIIAFFMHTLPQIIIATIYYFLRKNLRLRAIVFIGLAIFSAFFFNVDSNPIAFVIMTLPLILIAIFSYMVYKQRG